MRLALREASLAFLEEEVPVGALIVHEGRIIAKAHNSREASYDPTCHAELIAIRKTAKKLGTWRLSSSVLYVTKEPCIMCAGAMINARLKRVVYGCRDSKGGAVGSLYNILNDKRLNHRVEVVSGVLESECSEILKRFFKGRR
ncbi:MAG: nucleoside deaminase [Nitrospirae bacterium]|nr:nucleoside deaminase [Nitrospirota bacterium]